MFRVETVDACSQADAATRSVKPRRVESFAVSFTSVTPSTVLAESDHVEPAGAVASCNPLMRFSGVNRHSSSRPVGTSNTSLVSEYTEGAWSVAGTSEISCSLTAVTLANRAFHLKFDKSIEFKCVFHRKLSCNRLDESTHNHGHGFVFVHAT